jgi:pimeloyl-ACP methyl ester carboxylesterase
VVGLSEIESLESRGERIAFMRRRGTSPGVVWLGGFKSVMDGNKACAIDAWAAREGHAFVRFDYFGHGRSSGRFQDGTVTRWRDDALAVLDALTEGPQILVGSSMGGWLAMMLALLRKERVAGLFLIAPATDFTESLLWARYPEDVRREIMENGEWAWPSRYDDEPYPITRTLIEDGRKHLMLPGKTIAVHCPVRIFQGMEDPDVPWSHALTLVEALPADVRLTLVKDGDHRLARVEDLTMITRAIGELIADVAAR